MTMRFLYIIVIALFYIAHCSATNPAYALNEVCEGTLENSNSSLINACVAECKKAGGQWGGIISGRGRSPGCHLSTKDGNKLCTSPEDCEGSCLTKQGSDVELSGQCSMYKNVKGCMLYRDNGVVRQACFE